MTGELRPRPSAWPPLVALATVSALAIALLAVDLVIERRTADRTSELVDNSLQSVQLADDLGAQARRLATARGPAQLARVAARIEDDVRRYDPLANYPGERVEWTHLQGLLDRLGASTDAVVAEQIEDSIAKLVAINKQAAADNVAAIRHEHHEATAIGAIEVVAILALAGIVALFLVRALRRQDELVGRHLAMLAARQDEVESFARRVAHDLRGPLAPMRGYADMLIAGAPGKPIGEKLARVTDRMSAMVADLLELSLSGKPPPGETQIASVVDDVLAELQPKLADAQVTVEVPSCMVACSPGVLSQLLANLVTNSCKYRSPARPLAIEIRGDRHDGEVVLAVGDNGLGMAPDDAAHAFEPLYRARATSQIEGTGLGLAIVKRTIEAIGGDCQLESTRDVGTRVMLHLPTA